MAISPLMVLNGTADNNATEGKAKALAVRANPNGNTVSASISRPGAGPELTGQIDDEMKERYVKGKLVGLSSVRLAAYSSRQETRRRNVCHCLLGPS